MAKRRPYVTLDGSTVWELVRPEDGCSRVSVAKARIEEGKRTLGHVHHTRDEIYYVLGGEGVVYTGGRKRKVRPGDVVFIPARTEHFVVSIDGPMTLLCICAPPYRHEDTSVTEEEE